MDEEKKLRESLVVRLSLNDEMLKDVTENYKRIGETLNSLARPSKEIAELVEVQKRFVETTKSFQDMFDFSSISVLKDAVKSVLDRLKQINPEKYHEENIKNIKDRAERFSKMGWALVIDINDKCFFDDSIKEMKKDEVDEYMVNFYEENKHENLVALGKFIGKRINPTWINQIDDSVRLFKNGDYQIVIPFIMTLIEAEMIRYSGRDKFGWSLRDDFNKRIARVDDEYIFIAFILIEDFIQVVFDNKKTIDVEGELLNRNLVLHGKSNPELWGKVEFLKILNIVGSLAMLDDLFDIEKVV